MRHPDGAGWCSGSEAGRQVNQPLLAWCPAASPTGYGCVTVKPPTAGGYCGGAPVSSRCNCGRVLKPACRQSLPRCNVRADPVLHVIGFRWKPLWVQRPCAPHPVRVAVIELLSEGRVSASKMLISASERTERRQTAVERSWARGRQTPLPGASASQSTPAIS